MARTCPFCNSSEIDEDALHGETACKTCGSVIEESAITSDIQFMERGGGHEVIGQIVRQDRAQPNSLAAVPGLGRTESKEVTYSKGRQLIEQIGSQLRINKQCQEVAHNFFKMCVNRNFTRGRVRAHVVVSCLYMQCRLENTSHLLLDFSDVTQINVFDLGRTLTFLTRSFRMNLPPTDPCLYILRFASALELGDKERNVVDLATRIVNRMKNDWISLGRRPTGLCGAALLLAAKAFEINRTVTDIVRVVHISESVVRKRMDEFASTQSAKLSIEDFSTVDWEGSDDPPAFQESMKRAREQKVKEEKAEMEKRAETVSNEVGTVQKEIEDALRKKMKNSKYARFMTAELVDEEVTELAESTVAKVLREEEFDLIDEFAYGPDGQMASPSTSRQVGPSLESLGIVKRRQGTARVEVAENLEDEAAADGELDSTGIDDAEIDKYILSEPESKIKLQKWLARNQEHLEEQDRRKRLRDEKEEAERDQPKRKIPARRKKEPIQASTHGEAIHQVIQERKLSKKINWDILEEEEAIYKKEETYEPDN